MGQLGKLVGRCSTIPMKGLLMKAALQYLFLLISIERPVTFAMYKIWRWIGLLTQEKAETGLLIVISLVPL